MGFGDHIWSNEIYGIGIMAHGDDGYGLGMGELFQNFGNANFGNWKNIWGFKDKFYAISTNDPGAYPNVEFQVKGYAGTDIHWRSGTERIPHEYRCDKVLTPDLGKYCESRNDCTHQGRTSCGNGMHLNAFAPCNGQDQIWGIPWWAGAWEEYCPKCGKYLKDNGKISSYDCNKVLWGMDLKYWGVPPKKTVCTSGVVKVEYHTEAKWHEHQVWNIDNWNDWIGGCKHAGSVLSGINWITDNYSCSERLGGVFLKYYPRNDAFPIRTQEKGFGPSDDKCAEMIDFGRGGWCKASNHHLGRAYCGDKKYITCTDRSGSFAYKNCDGSDMPSSMSWPDAKEEKFCCMAVDCYCQVSAAISIKACVIFYFNTNSIIIPPFTTSIIGRCRL